MRRMQRLSGAMNTAEKGLQVDSIGRGGYDLDVNSLKPVKAPRVPGAGQQSAAQHASVEKAAQKSVANRRARAGLVGMAKPKKGLLA